MFFKYLLTTSFNCYEKGQKIELLNYDKKAVKQSNQEINLVAEKHRISKGE